MLAELLADPFFAAPPPKSTGRERFGDAYAAALHARRAGRRRRGHRGRAHRARASPAPSRAGRRRGAEVVASGGGCHHPGLMAALARRLAASGAPRAPALRRALLPGDAKEAVAFALLGYLTLHGQPGNVPAATGAAGPRVLGTVTPA